MWEIRNFPPSTDSNQTIFNSLQLNILQQETIVKREKSAIILDLDACVEIAKAQRERIYMEWIAKWELC